MLVLNGAAVSWISKCQTSITLSTCEAEYISLSQACQETIWVREILAFLRAPQTAATTVFEDNSAALQIANNVLDIKRSKAVDTRYHYSREKISEGDIKVEGVDTRVQLADILTKVLNAAKTVFFWTWGRGADMTE
jgi:hypothetical protein